MHTVTMPPDNVLEHKKECMLFTESLYILFKDNGNFSSSNDTLFQPPLTPGDYGAGTELGPFKALEDNTSVDLIFLDADEKKKRFDVDLYIKDDCSKENE